VNSENVVLLRAAWNRDYLDELRNFPRSRWKDQVDASAGAFSLVATPPRRVGSLFSSTRARASRTAPTTGPAPGPRPVPAMSFGPVDPDARRGPPRPGVVGPGGRR